MVSVRAHATIRDSSGAVVDHEELGNIWYKLPRQQQWLIGVVWCYGGAPDVLAGHWGAHPCVSRVLASSGLLGITSAYSPPPAHPPSALSVLAIICLGASECIHLHRFFLH